MKKVLLSVVVMLCFGAVWLVVGLRTLDTHSLISCAGNVGGIRLPQQVCWQYMRVVRDSKTDVEYIDSELGLRFLLESENNRKYQIADFYLKQGADINAINGVAPYRMSILHDAVWLGDIEVATYLINNNADANLVAPDIGVSPLQVAESQDIPNQQAIVAILSATQ